MDRGSLFALALTALPPGRRSRTGTGWLRDTRTRDPQIAEHESHSRARIWGRGTSIRWEAVAEMSRKLFAAANA